MKMKRIILNKTRKHSDRYYLVNDGQGMGGYGMPDDHYLRNWYVQDGIGANAGLMSVNYALVASWIPDEVKEKIRKILDIKS